MPSGKLEGIYYYIGFVNYQILWNNLLNNIPIR